MRAWRGVKKPNFWAGCPGSGQKQLRAFDSDFLSQNDVFVNSKTVVGGQEYFNVSSKNSFPLKTLHYHSKARGEKQHFQNEKSAASG
jgi:hypothetical protein